MLNRSIIAAALIAATIGFTACGDSKVPLDVIDTNQTVSRLNAQKNADAYFAIVWPEGTVESVQGAKPVRALMQADSSINQSCRFGDGWATGDILFSNGRKQEIKCQTNGNGKGINGCLTTVEFLKKDYASADKKCQNLPELRKM
jgi:hypothetical protein